MKIVLWVGDEPNQRALAAKVAAKHTVVGIVAEARLSKQNRSLKSLASKIFERVFLPVVGAAWRNLMVYYHERFPTFPAAAFLRVENINAEEVLVFTQSLEPDLILVSGTRLVKAKMLASVHPPKGILNLHTGLSPYVKGGPNCTNWCIATGQFHLIGNTVMWIDAGIDSGDICLTDFTLLDGSEDLSAVHVKVMEHAHQLYIDAAKAVIANKAIVNNIPQKSIGIGNTYYTKMWTSKQKKDLLRNFKHFANAIKSESYLQNKNKIKIIPL